MTTSDQTPDELRMAERYLAVLADISRCTQMVRNGDWAALVDQADALARRAAHLAAAASGLAEDNPPRAATVVDLVSRDRASEAAQLLHPHRPKTVATTPMTDPFTHPGTRPGASAGRR
ncbi:MAG: hypothetical protein HKP61_19890 [Dactylosporangium sp.]|nr:hypothetical protein [Dactylosporangium sp.]NNJ63147.1 hypothetical protein [Dactylosporangium sp.]